MAKIKDDAGEICEENDIFEIQIDSDDLIDETQPKFRKVCKNTRNKAIKNLNMLLNTFDMLYDPENTENMLLGLQKEERDKIYNHPLYNERDKDTKKGFTIEELLP